MDKKRIYVQIFEIVASLILSCFCFVALIAKVRMLHLFDVVFCSGDEGVAKPDPTAYLTTLERLAVAPEAAVFIDDDIDNVEAARALGMVGIHFSTAEALAEELEALLASP